MRAQNAHFANLSVAFEFQSIMKGELAHALTQIPSIIGRNFPDTPLAFYTCNFSARTPQLLFSLSDGGILCSRAAGGRAVDWHGR